MMNEAERGKHRIANGSGLKLGKNLTTQWGIGNGSSNAPGSPYGPRAVLLPLFMITLPRNTP